MFTTFNPQSATVAQAELVLGMRIARGWIHDDVALGGRSPR